jgi:hypothetical protein
VLGAKLWLHNPYQTAIGAEDRIIILPEKLKTLAHAKPLQAGAAISPSVSGGVQIKTETALLNGRDGRPDNPVDVAQSPVHYSSKRTRTPRCLGQDGARVRLQSGRQQAQGLSPEHLALNLQGLFVCGPRG